MHHLSYGNWWVCICSLFDWYSFPTLQTNLNLPWYWEELGYIDILLSVFPIFLPQIYTSLWRIRPTFDGKLYKYPCHLPSGWVWPVGGTDSMAEGWKERDWNICLPIFLGLTGGEHLAIPGGIDYWCPMRPWEKKKTSVGKPKITLDFFFFFFLGRQMPPLKVIESQMRKWGSMCTGFWAWARDWVSLTGFGWAVCSLL